MAEMSHPRRSRRLPDPDAGAAWLRQAGFERIEPFHAAFTFRGWVASAPSWQAWWRKPLPAKTAARA
jgi:hypothetical protein